MGIDFFYTQNPLLTFFIRFSILPPKSLKITQYSEAEYQRSSFISAVFKIHFRHFYQIFDFATVIPQERTSSWRPTITDAVSFPQFSKSTFEIFIRFSISASISHYTRVHSFIGRQVLECLNHWSMTDFRGMSQRRLNPWTARTTPLTDTSSL